MPSQRVDFNTLSHLTVEHRTKRLALLDKYSEVFFFENPRFVIIINQHELDVSADCKPPRLKVNYMSEDLQPLIEARIQELLRLSSVMLREGPQGGVFWGPVHSESKVRCV